MQTYQFRDEKQAIDIFEPSLPQPWIHYLSNGELHAFVSQAGGGFAWWKDAVEGRLSRYRMFHLPTDRPGFYLYVSEVGKQTFSPTYQPMQTALDAFRCTFSPGMAEYQCRQNAFSVCQQMYITPDENMLVWDVTICNETAQARTAILTAYTELAQMKWLTEQMYGYYWRHMLKTWKTEDALLCYLYQFHENRDYLPTPLVFFGSSGKLRSFSTDRNAFMGAYRDESNPRAIERGVCGNETLLSGEPCFAYQTEALIPANGVERVSFFLGIAPDALTHFAQAEENAHRIAALGRDHFWLDTQKQKLQTQWSTYLGKARCALPDAALTRMISTWAPINCMTTARYSRAVNTEAPGVRGIGYRDSAQDMIAMSARCPEMAESTLLTLLAHQFPQGNAVHLIPLNPNELPDARTRCDSHLWLPMLLYSILSETGEYDLLKKRVAFLSDDDFCSAHGEGTVWEHMMAAVNFTETHLGAHGLPLTLAGDWNDIIGKFSQKGHGESVFAAMQYRVSLNLLVQIAEHQQLPEANLLRQYAEKQKNAIETSSYAEEWWYRCFADGGSAIGGPDGEFGRIWLNPQSWAVISGVGTAEQNLSAMKQVHTQLLTDTGLKLLHPGFKTYPEVSDPFTGYNPGNGENGAIFCHANTWAIIAESLLGHGAQAWAYYELLAPQKILERMGLAVYRAEPYAWASNIVGPENPKHGWGNVTHISGTAAWMEIAANRFLLGFQPVLDGISFAPVMKPEWEQMYAERVWRGTRICMTVRNPNKEEHGIQECKIDGNVCEKAYLPASYLRGKKQIQVEVTLGTVHKQV